MSDDLIAVGRVGRPHGVDGAFVVERASDDPSRFEPGAVLLVHGEPATVVASRRVGRGRIAIRLDRAVERGARLQVRRTDLPALEEGRYYVADLIGLEIVEEGARIGRVRDVRPGPANDSLELDSGALLPLIEDCVLEVDLDAGRIVIAPGFTDAS